MGGGAGAAWKTYRRAIDHNAYRKKFEWYDVPKYEGAKDNLMCFLWALLIFVIGLHGSTLNVRKNSEPSHQHA